MFSLSPKTYLEPTLAAWPMPTQTGETMLVRPENDANLVLTRVRGGQEPLSLAFEFKEKADRSPHDLGPGAFFSHGTDYRGQAVFAVIRDLPGTPWRIVAKVDQAEAFYDLRDMAFSTAIILSTLLVAIAALASVVWHRGRLQAALGELELRGFLSRIATASPGALLTFRMEPGGGISIPFASAKFAEICGLDPAQLKTDARDIYKRIEPDDIERFNREIEASRADMRMFQCEFRINHPARGTRWLEARTLPERHLDGSISWHGFLFDITSRREADDRLRLSAIVFDSADEGVIVTDAHNSILSVNQAFTRITGYSQREAEGRKPNMLQSGRHDAGFYRDMWRMLTLHGSWRGEIWNRRKSGEIYPQWMSLTTVRDAAGNIVNHVAILADISKLKQSESQLEHMAHHDPLTGLPNRLLLHSRLEFILSRARQDGNACAVLGVNLDRFKTVNESLGHQAGDEMLLETARRLQACLGERDTLARFGGDEFVILIEHATPAAAQTLATRIIDSFAKPMRLDDTHDIAASASVGICLFPEDGATAGELMQHASTALYEAKRLGGGHFRFYAAALTDLAQARLELETNLHHALERDEFVLHYQPLVRVADSHTVGCEALIRWQGKGGGLVPPGLFIPVAEETGAIIPIGGWVLRTACRQLQQWRASGLDIDYVAVNLSPMQFRDSWLIERIDAVLKETGLPAHCLELEITESILAETGAELDAKLAALRRLGVRLAIDDFGTGYSSLAYLKRFPLDKLKIDRSFIRNLPDDAADVQISSAIISMARSLRLEVLAEGVETVGQLEFLSQHGCDTIQGFLYSPAIPAADFAARCEREARLGHSPLAAETTSVTTAAA